MSKKDVVLRQTQHQLLNAYRNWERRYPQTLEWRKKQALELAWWDRAAAVCDRHELSADLLLYVAFAYTNCRAEDAHVPFSANTLRAEHLLERAIANFRAVLNDGFNRTLEPLYILEHSHPLTAPRQTLNYARLYADYVCRYLEVTMTVKSYELTRTKGAEMPALINDSVAYKLCENNPFLLLRVAKTPRIRAMAAVNIFILCDREPWHVPIWEGIASPHSLSQPDEMAGCQVREFYQDQRLCTAWPLDVLDPRPFYQLHDRNTPPSLLLSQIPWNQKTDLYLSAKLHAARSGTPEL